MYSLKLTPRERLIKAKIKLYIRSPFFTYLVEYLRFLETEEVKTCAVDDYRNLFYNPKYIERIDIPKITGILCHEVMHLALEHHLRGKNKTAIVVVNGEVMSVWNIATDIVINNILVKNGFELPENTLIPKNDSIEIFGGTITEISKKSAEEIYEELLKLLKQNAEETQIPMPFGEGKGEGEEGQRSGGSGEEKDGEGEGGSEEKGENKDGQEGEGNTEKKSVRYRKAYKIDDDKVKGFDEHWWGREKKGNREDSGDEEVNIDWSKIIREAYNYAKKRGTVPAGLEREYDELGRPKINWRAILRKEVSNAIPTDFTWARPNKKYIWMDIYVPAIQRENIKVLVSIDTSGSISNEELSIFMREVVGIAKSFDSVEFRIITHDSEVQDDIPVKNGNIAKLKKIKIHGGGGTDHRPVYEYIEKKRYTKNAKLLISFTDGYSAYPEKPCIPTIFILAGDHKPKHEMPKWAKRVIELGE